jgi:hypothetical protein
MLSFLTLERLQTIEPDLLNFDNSEFGETRIKNIIEESYLHITNYLKSRGDVLNNYKITTAIKDNLDVSTFTASGYSDVILNDKERDLFHFVLYYNSRLITFNIEKSSDNIKFQSIYLSGNITPGGDTNLHSIPRIYSIPLSPLAGEYYRIRFTTTDNHTTNIIYQGYLADSSFYFAHCYLALSMIYNYYASATGDLFQTKADNYRQMYEQAVNNIVALYQKTGENEPALNTVGRVELSR